MNSLQRPPRQSFFAELFTEQHTDRTKSSENFGTGKSWSYKNDEENQKASEFILNEDLYLKNYFRYFQGRRLIGVLFGKKMTCAISETFGTMKIAQKNLNKRRNCLFPKLYQFNITKKNTKGNQSHN